MTIACSPDRRSGLGKRQRNDLPRKLVSLVSVWRQSLLDMPSRLESGFLGSRARLRFTSRPKF